MSAASAVELRLKTSPAPFGAMALGAIVWRGIDKLRKQQAAAGNADIAQAITIWPQIAEEFKRRGIVP